MTELTRLLVANRGEIAVRIARAARRLGVTTVGVAPEDDRSSPHLDRVDVVATLPGRGTAAYLDVDAVVSAAVDHDCDALHPGYGFLAEAAELAARCADAGVRFVGPSAESLAVLGDKAAARRRRARRRLRTLPVRGRGRIRQR